MDKVQFALLVSWLSSRFGQTMDILDIEELQMKTTPKMADMVASPETLEALMKAVHNGQEIEAIRHFRTMTGFGLRESKDAVERSCGW